MAMQGAKGSGARCLGLACFTDFKIRDGEQSECS
jgi:hypothetical protein